MVIYRKVKRSEAEPLKYADRVANLDRGQR
jgi:hypothetical protein